MLVYTSLHLYYVNEKIWLSSSLEAEICPCIENTIVYINQLLGRLGGLTFLALLNSLVVCSFRIFLILCDVLVLSFHPFSTLPFMHSHFGHTLGLTTSPLLSAPLFSNPQGLIHNMNPLPTKLLGLLTVRSIGWKSMSIQGAVCL